MKAIITIVTDSAADAAALGPVIEVEVEKVVVTADGELLETVRRPLLIEALSLLAVPPRDERTGPLVRIFTDARTAIEGGSSDAGADDTGGSPQGRKGKQRGGRRRADGPDDERTRAEG